MERPGQFHPPIAVWRGRFVLWGRMTDLSHSRPRNVTLRVHVAVGIVHHKTHGHALAGLGHSSRADEVPRWSAARLGISRLRRSLRTDGGSYAAVLFGLRCPEGCLEALSRKRTTILAEMTPRRLLKRNPLNETMPRPTPERSLSGSALGRRSHAPMRLANHGQSAVTALKRCHTQGA